MEIQSFDVDTAEGVKVVTFEGSLDTNTSGMADKHLNALIDNGARKVLINLEKLKYISSAGLRVLLVATKKIKGAGGELRISNLNETVREVFEISGFTMIFNVFDDQDKALAGF